MKLHALALVVSATAAAGCATTPDPYSVDAAAQLAPVATPAGAEAGITGPIEILGFALPFPDGDYSRTFAAYKVDLPEGAAPWVRIYTAASCDTPPDQAVVFADLGAIRRVGDQTHFFARGVQVGDREVDIDIGTVASTATLESVDDLRLHDRQARGGPGARGGPRRRIGRWLRRWLRVAPGDPRRRSVARVWRVRAELTGERYAGPVNITVVGAGVIGLTTALTLEEHGHAVRVVAAGTEDATTSAVAGACWFPYRAGPPDRVAAWAADTRRWLDALTADPSAGVAPLTGYEITIEPGIEPDAEPAPSRRARGGRRTSRSAAPPRRSPALRSRGATDRRGSSRRGSCRG